MEEILTESRQPQVGIFWLHNGQIIQFSADAKNEKAVAGFRDSPWDHWKEWDKLAKAYPEFRGKNYTDVPRGRVLYREADKKFVILSSMAILGDPAAIAKIKRAFSLPVNCVLNNDSHYESEVVFDDED